MDQSQRSIHEHSLTAVLFKTVVIPESVRSVSSRDCSSLKLPVIDSEITLALDCVQIGTDIANRECVIHILRV